MKKRVLIVHGIHTDEHTMWMRYFAAKFRHRGWDAEYWTYGYAYALLTRWQNPGRARKLASLIQPGDVVLGHSNGACLAWMAAEIGAPMRGAILLNPALDTDKVMAKQVEWANLYANRGDEAVKLAGMFLAHPWGAQGRDGLTVADPRYKITFTDDSRPAPMVWGHSDIFSLANLPDWSDRIIDDAEARL